MDDKLEVTLHVVKLDRVLVDRSAGQHENGWWVVTANYDALATGPYEDLGLFFLSETGVLYGKDGERSWTTTVGYQPGLVEAAAKLDMETLEPIPGRPGWAVDGTGTEWYSDAWIDNPPHWDTRRIQGPVES